MFCVQRSDRSDLIFKAHRPQMCVVAGLGTVMSCTRGSRKEEAGMAVAARSLDGPAAPVTPLQWHARAPLLARIPARAPIATPAWTPRFRVCTQLLRCLLLELQGELRGISGLSRPRCQDQSSLATAAASNSGESSVLRGPQLCGVHSQLTPPWPPGPLGSPVSPQVRVGSESQQRGHATGGSLRHSAHLKTEQYAM